MLGVTIGGYEVTETLAEGGMGAVFVARHSVMSREAVVKLLKPELSHDEAMTRRFLNEARAAAAINDPGIVQIFDVGFLPDGRAFIVMERLRGETLGHRLRGRGITVDHAVQILRLLARTLDAAHSHSIVHRDLKPDNIFLVPDPDVSGGERTKILDFGIAKLAGGEHGQGATRAGSIFGTPPYMAPEQCTDSATVDARADLYALGCIAYELLTGSPPFGFGGIELIGAHLRDEPTPIRERNAAVPEWLAVVVPRLLRKAPADRFASSAELLQALDTMDPRRSPRPIEIEPTLAPDAPSKPPVAAPSPAPTTHSQSAGAIVDAPAPRSRLPLIVGLGLVAIAAIAGVWLATREPPAPPRPAQPAVDEPSPKANALADAIEAAASEKWSVAIAAAAQVPQASPDRARANEVSERAQRELSNKARFDELVAELTESDAAAARRILARIDPASVYHPRALSRIEELERRAVAAKPDPAKPDVKPAKPGDRKSGSGSAAPAPKLTYADAIAKARAELAAAHHTAVLDAARAALAARPGDGEAMMHAAVSACALGDQRTARSMVPPGGTWREVAIGKCKLYGIAIE